MVLFQNKTCLKSEIFIFCHKQMLCFNIYAVYTNLRLENSAVDNWNEYSTLNETNIVFEKNTEQ